MRDSFNMRGWRHKFITMAENESAVVDQKMPRKWYVDNYDTIIEDIIRQGHDSEEAEEIWDTMYQLQCTYEDALKAREEAAIDFTTDKTDVDNQEIAPETDSETTDYNYVYEYFVEDEEDDVETKLKEAEKKFLSI